MYVRMRGMCEEKGVRGQVLSSCTEREHDNQQELLAARQYVVLVNVGGWLGLTPPTLTVCARLT